MNRKPVNAKELKIAKCEDCGGEAVFVTWPAGWTQRGVSKHDTEYQEEGLAWRCPHHREQQRGEGVEGGEK